jgi:predicted GH43/DUF377 family glycosyl hydrolase
MELKLKRHPLNPLLSPVFNHSWENKYVFNPAVIKDNGLFHMLYRAQGEDMVSRFGYAVSSDGLHFNRLEKPVFSPANRDELYGVEDPRITKMNDEYYIQYTAYAPGSIRIAQAHTKNFIIWERDGIIIPESPNKDAALFPEKTNGKYVMFHRLEPDLWLAFSDDLIHWGDYRKIASPREGYWDNEKIGIAGSPIKKEYGWLVLYHGVEKGPRLTYRLGFMVLDKDDPGKVLKRTEGPVLEPKEEWEVFGGVPTVVFSDSIVEHDEQFYVYYGAADNHIALATIEAQEVKKWAES